MSDRVDERPPGRERSAREAMRRRERLLVALAGAGAVAVFAYALVRVSERALFPEPNPALLIWSERSAFAWRSLLALHLGGAGGFGAYALTAVAPGSSARGLSLALGGAALALVALVVLAP